MKEYIVPFLMVLGLLVFFAGLATYHRSQTPKAEPKKKGVEVVCKTCGGTGEKEQDVNLMMTEASFAIWYNLHICSHKCEVCTREKKCDTAKAKYDEIISKYEKKGPEMGMAACPDCMGAGKYTQYEGYRFGRERE